MTFFSFNELVLTHQVRCNNGSETEVPGVILVIPPPDKKAVQQVQRSENNTSKGKNIQLMLSQGSKCKILRRNFKSCSVSDWIESMGIKSRRNFKKKNVKLFFLFISLTLSVYLFNKQYAILITNIT